MLPERYGHLMVPEPGRRRVTKKDTGLKPCAAELKSNLRQSRPRNRIPERARFGHSGSDFSQGWFSAGSMQADGDLAHLIDYTLLAPNSAFNAPVHMGHGDCTTKFWQVPVEGGFGMAQTPAHFLC